MKTVIWNRDKIEDVLLETAGNKYGKRLVSAILWVGDDNYAEYELRIEEETEDE